MKSIVFSISLLIVVGCVPTFACGIDYVVEPKNHWLFFTGYYAYNEWQTNLNKIFREENIAFWHDYVGKSVSREEVEDALYRENFLCENTYNEFFRYLINKHDTVALKYWKSIKSNDSATYEKVHWKQSLWYYPDTNNTTTPDRQRIDLSIIEVIKLDAECIDKCPDPNIRNRYVLQVMRKYFYTGDNKKCIEIWEKYGENVPQSALRTQCLNYYGGALLGSDRKADAAIVYAEIGYRDVDLHYDPNILREIYKKQPNCDGFEFLVQQFVNQYFDFPLPERAKDFNVLVDEIIKDGKSENPALWKSAQAAITYINNNTPKAIQLLSQAEKMRGSDIVKENIRMMRLIFNSVRTDNGRLYEETMYSDFKWLVENIKKDIEELDTIPMGYYEKYSALSGENSSRSNLPLHRMKVLRRVIFLGVVPHFQHTGMDYKSIAYLNLYDEVTFWDKQTRKYARDGKLTIDTAYCYAGNCHPAIYRGTYLFYAYDWDDKAAFRESYREFPRKEYDTHSYSLKWNYDYGRHLFPCIDTAKIETVLQYVDLLRSGGRTPMEKYVIKNSYCDLNYFYDLIGTKYIREGKYGTAISYLQQVSKEFLATQNIKEYICKKRNPFAEEWITNKTQCGKYDLTFDPVAEYDMNPGKLEFCRIMKRLESNCNTAKTAKEKANSAYAYAIGLYQSMFGYSWALTGYYNSYWNGDTGDPRYMDNDKLKHRKKVDDYIDIAMKNYDENLFWLKCMIIHSEFSIKLKILPYFYYDFAPEIQAAFCDCASDYADNIEN